MNYLLSVEKFLLRNQHRLFPIISPVYGVNQKHLERFEMWCWRRMEKISCTDHVRNEEVLFTVKEQRNVLYEIRK
jgi:hypothetical protein